MEKDNGKNICPEHGEMNYMEGKVKCSVHTKEDDGDSESGDISFLD